MKFSCDGGTQRLRSYIENSCDGDEESIWRWVEFAFSWMLLVMFSKEGRKKEERYEVDGVGIWLLGYASISDDRKG